MLVNLEAVAMPPDERGWCEVRHFAYTSDADEPANNGGGVRDANNALEIVQQLIGKAEEREFSSWYEGRPPQGEDVVPLWEVTIRVFRSHRHVSCYQVEYRRHNGCPAQATDAMMRTYRAVKQALKNGRKALEAEREQKRKKRGANS